MPPSTPGYSSATYTPQGGSGPSYSPSYASANAMPFTQLGVPSYMSGMPQRGSAPPQAQPGHLSRVLHGMYRSPAPHFGASNTMFSVSKPELGADGRWSVSISFQVGDQPVIVVLKASKEFGDRIQSVFGAVASYAKDHVNVSFGAENPYADTWGYFDVPATAAAAVANDPGVRAAIEQMSFGASAIESGSTVAQEIRAYRTGRVNPALFQDAARGNPQALQAAARLDQIASADRLLSAAKQNDPSAVTRLRAISQGLSAGDPHAIDAFLLLDGLHRSTQPQKPKPPLRVVQDWQGTESPQQLAQNMAQKIVFGDMLAAEYPTMFGRMRSDVCDFDSNLPDLFRQQVSRALNSSGTAEEFNALANLVASKGYPKTAKCLAQKAREIQLRQHLLATHTKMRVLAPSSGYNTSRM